MAKNPWFPTINSDQCNSCEGAYKCVKYCPNDVLETRDNMVSVIDPLGCIYGCSACAVLCPKDAIIFPSKDASNRSTRKTSLLHAVLCRGCGKRFSTGRDAEYCFDCEKKLTAMRTNSQG